jgi:hypothetical protein
MKDRIGNTLKVGDKVMVALPEASIFGFVAQVDAGGIITGVRSVKGGMQAKPGRILVSCVIALPVHPEAGQVGELVRVYDAEKHEEDGADGPKLITQ